MCKVPKEKMRFQDDDHDKTPELKPGKGWGGHSGKKPSTLPRQCCKPRLAEGDIDENVLSQSTYGRRAGQIFNALTNHLNCCKLLTGMKM